MRFWERLLDGADNIAYRLGVNTLVDGAYVAGEHAQAWFIEEIRVSNYRLPIALAIGERDPDKAEAVARKIMRTAVESFAVSIGRPIAPPPAANEAKGRSAASAKPSARGRGLVGQRPRKT